MAVVYGINQAGAELKLSAMDPSRQILHAGVHYSLRDAKGREIAHSDDASAHFQLPPGQYGLLATHQGKRCELQDLKLKASERSELVVMIPQQRDPNNYYIENEDQFNSVTEYQRRGLERKGQHAYGKAADALAEPVSREEAQARRGRTYGRQMGMKAHPLLQKPQFDGMDPQVNPKPDENEGVQLQLQQELQNALQANNRATPTMPPNA